MDGLASERTLPFESALATGQFKEAKELREIFAGGAGVCRAYKTAPRRRRSVEDVARLAVFVITRVPPTHPRHSICSIDDVDNVHLLHTASQEPAWIWS